MKKIFFLNVMFFGIAFSSFGQDKSCIGKWKLFPKPQDGVISYLTVSENNNEYYLVRTKDPKQKWKMTWNEKSKAFDVDLEGKKCKISMDKNTKHLVFDDGKSGKFEMIADK